MSKKILIIDDEPDVVRLIESLLQPSGYQTLSALDGEEGLRLAKEELPTLIILDLKLPKMTGLEICKTIREDRDGKFNRTPLSYTPIIMLTGKSDDVDRVIGHVIGADDYFTKPFDFEVLLVKIEEFLKGSPPAGQS